MIKNKKGFSLVELIVIIAVMAVLIAVLAPSLLSYTERSRAQKDVSSMDEVVNAVQLAMANSDVYDEAIKYSCSNNFITYTDSSGRYGQQELDGEYWAPDGSGKATTITFNPETDLSGNTIYKLENGIVNDMTYGNGSVAQDRVMEGAQIENNQCYLKNMTQLYNLVRQSIGNDVITTSATYKNSSFTIFITFSQKDGVKVADVSGMFNGTNLLPDSQASKGSGTSTYDPNTGDANTTVTSPGKQETQFTQSDLSGGGQLVSSINTKLEDYKQITYIENLQKEEEFHYYSSAYLASVDISNGSIGTSADCKKEDAVAGVYIDKSEIPTLVVLKDNVETSRLKLLVQTNIILGGHTLTFCSNTENKNANVAIDMYRGGMIDGRIGGSAIILQPKNNSKHNLLQFQNTGSITIVGGKYCIDGPIPEGAILITIDDVSDIAISEAYFEGSIKSCTGTSTTEENNFVNIITFQSLSTSVKISNSTIIGHITSCVESGETSLNAINMKFSDVIINNCNIQAINDCNGNASLTGIKIREDVHVDIIKSTISSDKTALAIFENAQSVNVDDKTKIVGIVDDKRK